MINETSESLFSQKQQIGADCSKMKKCMCGMYIKSTACWVKTSADEMLKYFIFSQKIGSGISCKLAPQEQIKIPQLFI